MLRWTGGVIESQNALIEKPACRGSPELCCQSQTVSRSNPCEAPPIPSRTPPPPKAPPALHLTIWPFGAS